jgi:hypothetical protein
MEREALCGSAYKRLALIEAAAGRSREERRAISRMQAHYARAETLGRDGGLAASFYPALNRIAADLVLHAGERGWRGLDPSAVALIRRSLAETVRDNPDFWCVAGQIELSMYEAVATGLLSRARRSIEAAYEDLHTRVAAPRMWGSVRDQAQFVLRRYAARANVAEQRAALALIRALEQRAAPHEDTRAPSGVSRQSHA